MLVKTIWQFQVLLVFHMVMSEWSVWALPASSSGQSQPLKYFLFTETCFNTLFHQGNLTDISCLKFAAGRILGYSIILGSGIVKVPQIIKIVKNHSVEGVSFTALCMELLNNILIFAYCWHKGSPFSAYGEAVCLGVQILMIMAPFLTYGKGSRVLYGLAMTLGITLFAASFYENALPKVFIDNSIFIQILLISFARLTQLYEVIRLKSTGQLSPITVGLSLLGNIGRVLSLHFEGNYDGWYFKAMFVNMALNLFLVLTFVVYPSSPQKPNTIQKPKKA